MARSRIDRASHSGRSDDGERRELKCTEVFFFVCLLVFFVCFRELAREIWGLLAVLSRGDRFFSGVIDIGCVYVPVLDRLLSRLFVIEQGVNKGLCAVHCDRSSAFRESAHKYVEKRNATSSDLVRVTSFSSSCDKQDQILIGLASVIFQLLGHGEKHVHSVLFSFI